MTLIIPRISVENGDIINGVADFVTDTKPTTRIGGAALVTGDRWYKSDDGTEWFWNGTYWLESKLRTTGGGSGNITSNANVPAPTTNTINNYPVNRSVFLERAQYNYSVATTNNGSNYWTLSHRIYPLGGVALVPTGVDTSLNSSDTVYQASEVLNQFLNKTSNYGFIGGFFVKTGTPGILTIYCSIEYRIVAD